MANRYALIIGNSDYQDSTLSHLAMPEADVNGLAAVLKDPQIGAFDSVTSLVNRPSFEVRYEIESFFDDKKPDDLLLLYYTGHGIRDEQGQLYLAVNDTKHNRLRSTAIDAAYITGLMDGSRSKRQVLILDCCHSGSFAQGSKAMTGESVGIKSAFEGTGYGRVVLTATDATQYAWEGDQIIGEAKNSVFTLFLLQALRSGEADTDQDGKITLDELYDYVYEKVVSVTPKQTPGKSSYKQQGEIIIADNPRALLQPPALPAPLQHAIESPLPSVRQAAVQDLEQLLRGSNRALALAARDALRHLAEDDSHRVATVASAALKTFDETAANVPAAASTPPATAISEGRAAARADVLPKAPAGSVGAVTPTLAPTGSAPPATRERIVRGGGGPGWLLVGGGILVGMCICLLALLSIPSLLTPATPTPLPPYSVVFADDFKGNCKLPMQVTGGDRYLCENGEFTIQVNVGPPRWVYYEDPSPPYTDIILEVEARAVFQVPAEYGVIFRVARDRKSFYGFTVTSDGRYTLFKYNDSTFSTLINYTGNQAIRQGTATNTIQVVAQGDQIALYVNNQWLDTVSDSSLSSGAIGFFLYSSTAGGEAAFANLVISQINTRLTLPPGKPVPTPTRKP